MYFRKTNPEIKRQECREHKISLVHFTSYKWFGYLEFVGSGAAR